jgi:signal transduction histidine kinase/CheY-like chemotaxis protein
MGVEVAVNAIAIVDALPTPALLVVDGKLAAINGPALATLGITAEAIGTPVRALRLVKRIPGLAEAMVRAARGVPSASLTVRALATPAGLRSMRLTARPVTTASDSHAVLLLADDLGAYGDPGTGRGDEAEARFMATVAHELRSPLSAVLHALHLIGQRTATDRVVRHVRLIAERQIRHQARLLEDLLDVSRVRTGKIDLRPERLDLGDVVRQAIDSVRVAIEAKAQRLAHVSMVDRIPVRGDPTRIEQVFRNLLDNARKYTPVGGHITVWLGIEGGAAVARVTDTGEGIEPEALGQIFEPYAQLDSTHVGSRGGLGLGLSLVRSLVEQHGGFVAARSGGRGLGSEFEVRLPIDAAPAPARTEATPAAGVVRRQCILVIEDDRDARELLRLVLELDGHTVEAVASGADGVRMASASAPDVVLIDLGLPEMDGFEVARRIRKRLGEAVRLVALTGYGGEQTAHRAREAGFDAHVVKPAGPEEISAALAG